MRLPWLAHEEALGPYITIPQYRFNKTKQHTEKEWKETRCTCGVVVAQSSVVVPAWVPSMPGTGTRLEPLIGAMSLLFVGLPAKGSLKKSIVK